MSLTLRFFHYLGFLSFGGAVIHDFFKATLSSGYIFYDHISIKIFHFFSIPAFLIILISGILIIVQKPYYFKQEKWLQKKFIFSITIMIALIVGIFPEMKQFAISLSQTNGMPSSHLNIRFLISIIIVIVLLLLNLRISLKHRLLLSK